MANGKRSVMTHKFSEIPEANIPRSQFNRSHGYKTTFDAGYLIPFFADEALPGDTLNLRASVFARLATPIVPLMDNMFLDTFFFAVPIRLLWDNWKKMNGEQTNPGDSTSYLVPISTSPAGGYLEGSLQDYLGLPTKKAGYTHTTLFTRAYNLIWNEWFRDQNLQNSVTVDTGNGPDTVTNYVLLKRGKRHDYFTSCLPWPQKGTAVSLPLGTSATVKYQHANTNAWKIMDGATGNQSALDTGLWDASGRIKNDGKTQNAQLDPDGNLYADLSTATAATINQLREAFQIQRLYERDARGGTRYIEVIRSHFGVVSPDARVQRPEYLGGGSSPINIHPVAQTSPTSGSNALGQLAGFGTASFTGHGFVKSFTEHCVVLGLICARADLNYQQGLDKMFTRRTRWDFYWPALSHLGEQAVLNKEIYCNADANDDLVFGYQERFAEYRYKPSRVTGLFRSNATGTLDFWHLAQNFGALPTLGDTFIKETPPMSRVLAVAGAPNLILDAYFQYKTARPMPTYSVPGLIDHF